MRKCIGLGALGILLGPLGCDDGGGGGGSGVDGAAKIQELEAAELRKLCEWERNSYLDSLGSEEDYCTAFAINAPDEERCQEEVDECIASDEYENELVEDWECEDQTTEGLEECEATVAQYEACIAAIDKAEAELFTGLSCSDEPPDEGGEYEIPEPCEVVIELCPEILEGIID